MTVVPALLFVVTGQRDSGFDKGWSRGPGAYISLNVETLVIKQFLISMWAAGCGR